MSKSTRIKIPNSESDIVQLAGTIKAKHTAEAAASPLAALPWSATSDKIDAAVANDNKIAELDSELEQRRQQRTNDVAALGEFVRSARDVLQGVHRDTLRKLNDWGFNVDDIPRQKKPTPPALSQPKGPPAPPKP